MTISISDVEQAAVRIAGLVIPGAGARTWPSPENVMQLTD